MLKLKGGLAGVSALALAATIAAWSAPTAASAAAGAAPAAPAAAIPSATKVNFEGFWRLKPGYGANNDRAEPGRDGLARDWMAFGSFKFVERPPLTPEALAGVRERIKEEMAGSIIDERTRTCQPGSFYDMMTWGSVDILQRAHEVVFIIERDRAMPRRVFMNPKRPDLENLEPTLGGDARGHWEGDTLVVESRHIDNRPFLYLADFILVSEDLKVTERYKLEDGGQTLAVQYVYDDPKTFTKPWVVDLKYGRLPDTYEPAQDTCMPNARFE